MTDNPTGFAEAPSRYMASGRETIDRIRDALGDEGFVQFCTGTAMRYEDRAGLKDGNSLEQDLAKASFYRQMVAHVLDGRIPDPRFNRPNFVPYVRP